MPETRGTIEDEESDRRGRRGRSLSFAPPRFAFFIACFSFFILASDARWPE
jgi:hypothetical protein